MFFSDKISKIPAEYRVLEVGPGGNPHPRSDVLLEKIFKEEDETVAQRGYAPKLKTKKKVVFFEGGVFPFKDKEFDYVICSHVLEHIPYDDVPLFILELQRVSKGGFIEFPTIFYELINHQDVHLWYMNFRNGTVYFLDKNIFKSNYTHKVIREMFYGRDQYLTKIFNRYRELFFSYFEWEGFIQYKFVVDYDELINREDFQKYSEYFKNFKNDKHLKESYITLIKRSLFSLINTLRILFTHNN